jgi:sugar phosphate isomerase/epimerase
MQKAKIGLIGVINEQAKQDFWGTMQRVAAIGYQGMEAVDGFLVAESEADTVANVGRFHELGLKVLTTSTGREQLRDNLDGIIARAHSLQTPRVSVWWAPCDSRESVLEDAALYNEVGARLADEGLTLCYHHHHHEFHNVFGGVYALDLLAANTDPAALKFVIDLAWVAYGGEDPVRVVNRYQGRIATLHVKDVARLNEKDQFTAVGTGVVDIQSAVRAATDNGLEWIVVEQDRLRNLNAFDTVTLSYLYLKEAGLI